jgi:hypothetical protein
MLVPASSGRQLDPGRCAAQTALEGQAGTFEICNLTNADNTVNHDSLRGSRNQLLVPKLLMPKASIPVAMSMPLTVSVGCVGLFSP